MNMALDSVDASCHSHMLATAARDGSVTVFNIEKQSMVASRNIDCKVSYWHLSQPQNSSVVGADYTHTQSGSGWWRGQRYWWREGGGVQDTGRNTAHRLGDGHGHVPNHAEPGHHQQRQVQGAHD